MWAQVVGFALTYYSIGESPRALAWPLALMAVAIVIASAVATMILAATQVANRFELNLWLVLTVAAVLSGMMVYWLLRALTAINACTIGVAFPLGGGVCGS